MTGEAIQYLNSNDNDNNIFGASRYISHVLGYEGKGSLHSLLNSKGWIESFSAGSSIRTADMDIFKVCMSICTYQPTICKYMCLPNRPYIILKLSSSDCTTLPPLHFFLNRYQPL